MEIKLKNFDLEVSSRSAVSTWFELPNMNSRITLCDTYSSTRGRSVSDIDKPRYESERNAHDHLTIQQLKRAVFETGVGAGVNRGKPPRGRPRWER